MHATDPVRYEVLHDTRYDYTGRVLLSRQMLHLYPRTLPWQQVHVQTVDISPAPSWQQRGQDAFGNAVQWFSIDEPHDSLQVCARLEVTVWPHLPAPASLCSPAWEQVRDRLRYRAQPMAAADLAASGFLFESPCVPILPELKAYAHDSFAPGRALLESVGCLMKRVHSEFVFDPAATTVSTPVLEVLHKRRGVCQDFAHFMIGCLRSLGLSARYVSGYLLTRPPPGQPRLVGADASHAWVEVHCPGVLPGSDWIAFDPTNDMLPDAEHVTVAVGRDFSDVSPMRGVILGGGDHLPQVAVTMRPLTQPA